MQYYVYSFFMKYAVYIPFDISHNIYYLVAGNRAADAAEYVGT